MMVSVEVAAHRPIEGLDVRDFLGAAILAVAIGGESLADWQLARFKKTNTRKGAICEAGLWRWSAPPQPISSVVRLAASLSGDRPEPQRTGHRF